MNYIVICSKYDGSDVIRFDHTRESLADRYGRREKYNELTELEKEGLDWLLQAFWVGNDYESYTDYLKDNKVDPDYQLGRSLFSHDFAPNLSCKPGDFFHINKTIIVRTK